jgi:SAM-dependent methyltransferase
MGSEPFNPRNLLDRVSGQSTLQHYYDHMLEREAQILDRRLRIESGDVLSIGSGWHPGRHLFPAPQFRIVAADVDPAKVSGVLETRRADEAIVGRAGELGLEDRSFDVVLYRLVLHHLAYQGTIGPMFSEARRVLRPGGALVAIEPGLWHPMGLALAAANRVGLATAIHGTPDDIPLSPVRLARLARAAALEPELHAVTYSWRRLPIGLQAAIRPLDSLGSRSRAALFGHTLLLIARAPS